MDPWSASYSITPPPGRSPDRQRCTLINGSTNAGSTLPCCVFQLSSGRVARRWVVRSAVPVTRSRLTENLMADLGICECPTATEECNRRLPTTATSATPTTRSSAYSKPGTAIMGHGGAARDGAGGGTVGCGVQTGAAITSLRFRGCAGWRAGSGKSGQLGVGGRRQGVRQPTDFDSVKFSTASGHFICWRHDRRL